MYFRGPIFSDCHEIYERRIMNSGIDPGLVAIPLSSARIHTATGVHRLTINVANRFKTRFFGLMFQPSLFVDTGLLLTRCSSVHTCFMKEPIDVVYLDSSGIVIKCVEFLFPWRLSHSVFFKKRSGLQDRLVRTATHTLELAAGTIDKLNIDVGSRFHHGALVKACEDSRVLSERSNQVRTAVLREKQRGSAMIEFAVVAPIITLMGLATLQYGLLFFAKNQFNHAVFMAARAGSTGNAAFAIIEKEYARSLVPIYGGGTTSAEIAASYALALADVQNNVLIEVLNPTAESFADFSDPSLSARIGNGKRVIPNGGQIIRSASVVRAASGQNIQDANLLKLRVTHGFKPQVPLIGWLYTRYLQWMDTGMSAFNTSMIASQRIPVVSHVTVQMQSDAIEDRVVSSPGAGNGGAPGNPATPVITTAAAPQCASVACGTLQADLPLNPGPGGNGTPATPSSANGTAGSYSGLDLDPDNEGNNGGVCQASEKIL